MPELPEVETTVRQLRLPLIGKRILGVRTNWPKHLARPDPDLFGQRISGRRISAIYRRGKYLTFELDNGESLIVHLKMSGHLSVVDAETSPHRHDHTVFALDNEQELRFRDQRKFGRIYLVEHPDELFSGLGPEPLEPQFTVELLKSRLAGRSRALKPLLLDQGFVAGIGNIYANEALFHARIHPQRPANRLTPAEITALHKAIQLALTLGLQNGGASIDQYLRPDGSKGSMQNELAVHGREGGACNNCGATVERKTIGGRGTFFCPMCQV